MKNLHNMWPSEHARKSPASIHRKLNTVLKEAKENPIFEPASDLQDLIAILPTGCWSMNNCKGILTLNVHSHELHSVPCQLQVSVSGKHSTDVEGVKEKYLEWKHLQDVKDYPSLF